MHETYMQAALDDIARAGPPHHNIFKAFTQTVKKFFCPLSLDDCWRIYEWTLNASPKKPAIVTPNFKA